MHFSKNLLAMLALTTTAVIWGLQFVFAKIALQEITPLSLMAMRVIGASLILYPIMKIFQYKNPDQKNKDFKFRNDMGLLFRLGFFGIFLNPVLIMSGLNLALPSHASLITSTIPVFVLILAWILALEKISWLRLSGVILSFIGVFGLTGQVGLQFSWQGFYGNLLLLGGSAAFAFYIIWSQPLLQKAHYLTVTTQVYLIGCIFTFPVASYDLWHLKYSEVSGLAWLCIGYCIIFASLIAYILYYFSLQYIDASRAASFFYLQPLVTAVASILLLNEKITTGLIIWGFCILLGLYLTQKEKKRIWIQKRN